MNRLLGVLVLALSLSGAGCTQVDLEKALNVTDVFTGWYDFGPVGEANKLVPSFSFKLQNNGDAALNRVMLLVSFWESGATDESDSKTITGIGPDSLGPGASTQPILVRSDVGYTLESPQTKDDLFMHGRFKDFSVRLFARRSGRLISLGEFPIDRRIIPSTTPAVVQP